MASSNTVRYLILGCGRVATSRYVDLFTDELNGAIVAAVCDIDDTKANRLAAAMPGDPKAYVDYLIALQESKPDVVCILTESGNHFDHAKLALEFGTHVVVEKPATMIPEQAYELQNLAAKKGLMISEVKQNRWNPAIIKLKETFDSGRFGKIVTATIRLRWCRHPDYYEDGWHGTWRWDGGVINQQAIHHVDALCWICGPVQSICAHNARRANNPESDDTMVAILQLENGGLGTIEATTAARPRDFEASLSIVGEKGIAVVGGIALNQIGFWEFTEALPEDASVAEMHSQEVPTGYGLGHAPYLQAVTDRMIAGNLEPLLPLEDGVRALEVVHGMYASIETGTWVHMADNPRSTKLGIGNEG